MWSPPPPMEYCWSRTQCKDCKGTGCHVGWQIPIGIKLKETSIRDGEDASLDQEEKSLHHQRRGVED